MGTTGSNGPPRSVTIHDVAESAGVSIATVSRVINQNPTVAPELTERVLRSISATGFVPNHSGRALRRQVSDVFAAIVSDSQNSFFTTLVAGMEEVAAANGLSVMLSNTNEDLVRERQVIQAALGHRMAGVVIAVASETKSDLAPLIDAAVPTVLVDRKIARYAGDSVLVDNRLAGQLAAEHLLSQGYSRPAVVTGPSYVSTSAERLRGFRSAMKSHGVRLPRAYVRSGALRADQAEIAVHALLDGDEPPDSLFAINSPMAAGAFRALRSRGVRLPDDFGLVGMDDDVWMQVVEPAVTVVTQPVREIGRAAAELLLARRDDPQRPGVSIVLSPTLVERDSASRHTPRSGSPA